MLWAWHRAATSAGQKLEAARGGRNSAASTLRGLAKDFACLSYEALSQEVEEVEEDEV